MAPQRRDTHETLRGQAISSELAVIALTLITVVLAVLVLVFANTQL